MKQKRLLGRLLLLLLSLSFVLGTAAACTTEVVLRLPSGQGTGTIPTNTIKLKTDPASQQNTSGKLETHAPGYIQPNIPLDVNLGRVIRILTRQSSKDFLVGNEESTDTVLQDVCKNNWMLEDYLSCEFEWISQEGEWNDRNAFVEEMESKINTGSSYDLAVCQPQISSWLAEKGLTVNLASTRYIDLSYSWWPQMLLNDFYTNNRLYFTTPLADIAFLDSMRAIFVNNRLIKAAGVGDPIALIEQNQWSFSQLATLIKETDQNLNPASKSDEQKIWAYRDASEETCADWLLSTGANFVTRGETGKFQVMSEVDFSYGLTLPHYLQEHGASFEPTDGNLFLDGSVAFYKSPLSFAKEIASQEGSYDYAVLPMPKYSPEVRNYHTPVGDDFNAWVIPVGAKRKNDSSLILEFMAQTKHDLVYPAYFSTYVSGMTANQEAQKFLFDLICDNAVTDFALLHAYTYTNEIVRTPWRVMENYHKGTETGTVTDLYRKYKDDWDDIAAMIYEIYGGK